MLEKFFRPFTSRNRLTAGEIADGTCIPVSHNGVVRYVRAGDLAAWLAANKPGGTITFTPITHASTHATGGTDELTPEAIGAAEASDARLTNERVPTSAGLTSKFSAPIALSEFTLAGNTSMAAFDADNSMAPGSITLVTFVNWLNFIFSTSFASYTHEHTWEEIVDKPTTFPPIIGAGADEAVAGNDSRLTDARVPTAAGLYAAFGTSRIPINNDRFAIFNPVDQSLRYVTWGTLLVTARDTFDTLYAAAAHTHAWSAISGKPTTFPPTIGAGAADAVAGNDPRLVNARTPTAHRSTHMTGGDDPLTPADIGAADEVHSHAGMMMTYTRTAAEGHPAGSTVGSFTVGGFPDEGGDFAYLGTLLDGSKVFGRTTDSLENAGGVLTGSGVAFINASDGNGWVQYGALDWEIDTPVVTSSQNLAIATDPDLPDPTAVSAWKNSGGTPYAPGEFVFENIANSDAEIANAVGDLCRVGDAAPYDWYRWNGDAWEDEVPPVSLSLADVQAPLAADVADLIGATDLADMQAKLGITGAPGAPYNAGNITGDISLDAADGLLQKLALTGATAAREFNPPASGSEGMWFTARVLNSTGSPAGLTLDAAIVIPSDSLIIFPKELATGLAYIIRLYHNGTAWELVTFVGGY